MLNTTKKRPFINPNNVFKFANEIVDTDKQRSLENCMVLQDVSFDEASQALVIDLLAKFQEHDSFCHSGFYLFQTALCISL